MPDTLPVLPNSLPLLSSINGVKKDLHGDQFPAQSTSSTAMIPFPAPFQSISSLGSVTPLRPKRYASTAAISPTHRSSSSQRVATRDYAESDVSGDEPQDEVTSQAESSSAVTKSEPDLTNDDTAESFTLGETDEQTLEEDEAYDAAMDDDAAATSDDDESVLRRTVIGLSPAKRKRATPIKRKRAPARPIVEDTDEDAEKSMHLQAKAIAEGHQDTKPILPGKHKKVATKPRRSVKAKSETNESVTTNPIEEEKDGHASDQSALTDLEQEEKPKKKARKPRKPREPKPEPTYVIPDVEKLPNPGYEGRLGYACLNTILRKRKPPVFCSRTCRIDTINKNGMDFLKELGKQNCRDLAELIQWNEDNNIRFMRLSSEMFPFASHGEYGYNLEYAEAELKAAGALANKYGHRITTHPGQFTQLGSPRKIVVENAVKDLTYHCEMLDRMGIGKEGVMIIHGGGIFGDKESAMKRFRENYTTLLSDRIKSRLVLENDEMCYNVDDLLPVCEELNIPMVLDFHHWNIFPSATYTQEEIMPRILATWERKGIKPKFHLSEERPGAVTIMERRAHSDRCKRLPALLPSHVDLMIEAKDKEQAVFQLYRIYNLQLVKHESLRPPAEVESLRTNGRKSSKKKKSEVEDGLEATAEEGLEDPEINEHDETLVNVEGVEVMPPAEGAPLIKKPRKSPAKPRAKKMAVNGADGRGEANDTRDKKPTAARKPRAKRTEVKVEAADVDPHAVASAVSAEPIEAQHIETMELRNVQESILNAVDTEPALAQ